MARQTTNDNETSDAPGIDQGATDEFHINLLDPARGILVGEDEDIFSFGVLQPGTYKFQVSSEYGGGASDDSNGGIHVIGVFSPDYPTDGTNHIVSSQGLGRVFGNFLYDQSQSISFSVSERTYGYEYIGLVSGEGPHTIYSASLTAAEPHQPPPTPQFTSSTAAWYTIPYPMDGPDLSWSPLRLDAVLYNSSNLLSSIHNPEISQEFYLLENSELRGKADIDANGVIHYTRGVAQFGYTDEIGFGIRTSNGYEFESTISFEVADAPYKPTIQLKNKDTVNEGSLILFLVDKNSSVSEEDSYRYHPTIIFENESGAVLARKPVFFSSDERQVSYHVEQDSITENQVIVAYLEDFPDERIQFTAIADETEQNTTAELEPVVEQELISSDAPIGNHSLTAIADVFGSIIFLDNITEIVSNTSHIVYHAGSSFNYEDIDSFVTTVIRNGEFTAEFQSEIAESFPMQASINHETAVALIGQANMESTLMMVAGADGNYVG